MQIRQNKNPWGDEGGFEQVLSAGLPAGRQGKKAVGDTTKAVAKDVKDQLFGVPEPVKSKAEEMGVKEVPDEEKRKIEAETMRRLADLNAKIEEVRKRRLKKEEESVQVKEQEKKAAYAKATAAKQEPVWKKMMKMGSQSERKVNAGG